MAEINCAGRTTREINAEIRRAIAAGDREVVVKDPGARHNLAVAILDPAHILIAGSAGYFCGGLIDGAAHRRLKAARAGAWLNRC